MRQQEQETTRSANSGEKWQIIHEATDVSQNLALINAWAQLHGPDHAERALTGKPELMTRDCSR
jgi:hypothetical protein